MIAAEVIADSVSPAGVRLTTLQVDMHRFVLPEFNTHRVFSRNSASSRAIPLKQRIEAVRNDPAMPIEWGRNQPGMQAAELLDDEAAAEAERLWRHAAQQAADTAERMAAIGLHKQVAARILEPVLWHRVVVTGTSWAGFWAQRRSPLAQPEIRAVAEAMHTAMAASAPRPIERGEWHLPYVDTRDLGSEFDAAVEQHGYGPTLQAMSVARCARVSYLNEGRRDIADDLRLYHRLLDARPVHASPFEHVATPARLLDRVPGNFAGWHQLRHTLDLDRHLTSGEVTS